MCFNVDTSIFIARTCVSLVKKYECFASTTILKRNVDTLHSCLKLIHSFRICNKRDLQVDECVCVYQVPKCKLTEVNNSTIKVILQNVKFYFFIPSSERNTCVLVALHMKNEIRTTSSRRCLKGVNIPLYRRNKRSERTRLLAARALEGNARKTQTNSRHESRQSIATTTTTTIWHLGRAPLTACAILRKNKKKRKRQVVQAVRKRHSLSCLFFLLFFFF